MKKTVFCLLALSTLAFGVSSCGNKKGNNLDGVNDLKKDESGNIIYENVKLNLWSVTTGDDAKVQDAIIAKFNETYKGMIEVTTNHQSRYDLESLLENTMQFDDENAPDILFNHGMRVTEYNTKDWLSPIEDYYELAGISFDKDDFADSLLNATTIDGKAYGTPIDVHSAMIEIRVDILEKNNLKMPTNYAELVEVCDKANELAKANNLWIRGYNSEGYKASEWRKASTEGYTAFPYSYGDMWVHEFAGYTAIVQNGASIVDDKGMPAWNSNEAANGLQVLKDGVFPTSTSKNKSAMTKYYGSEYDVGVGPFRSGEAIFTLNGPWTYLSDARNFDTDLKDDGGRQNITTRSLSNLFAMDNTKEYANKIKGEGHAVMLMSTTESWTKRCAAAIFADYLAYNGGIEWAKSGHIPAASSVLNNEDFRNNEAYKEYVQYWGTPDDYVVYGPTEHYSYCDQYFKQALQKSLNKDYKDKTTKELLEKEYKDCVDYIALYQ